MSDKVAVDRQLALLFDVIRADREDPQIADWLEEFDLPEPGNDRELTLGDAAAFLVLTAGRNDELIEWMGLATEWGNVMESLIFFGRLLQKYGADMPLAAFSYIPKPNAYGHPDWSHLDVE